MSLAPQPYTRSSRISNAWSSAHFTVSRCPTSATTGSPRAPSWPSGSQITEFPTLLTDSGPAKAEHCPSTHSAISASCPVSLGTLQSASVRSASSWRMSGAVAGECSCVKVRLSLEGVPSA